MGFSGGAIFLCRPQLRDFSGRPSLRVIRQIGLIPTEYVFFYLRPWAARANQLSVGSTRGEELVALNTAFNANVAAACEEAGPPAGLRLYASYLQLKSGGASAFAQEPPDRDPLGGDRLSPNRCRYDSGPLRRASRLPRAERA